MRIRTAAAVGFILIASSAGCGETSEGDLGATSSEATVQTIGGSDLSATTSDEASRDAVETPVATTAPIRTPSSSIQGSAPSATWSALDEVRWLSVPATIDGFRLTAADRRLASDCGPDSDCPGTVPVATLDFTTDDLDVRRSLTVSQYFEGAEFLVFDRTAGGEQRTLGARTVNISEQGTAEAPYITAGWDDPEGYAVELTAAGLSIETLEAIIVSLEPAEPDEWPGVEVLERLTPCVDGGTQYAPAIIPPGWNRFVLEAQPTGTCDINTVLFMSLVEPGTEQQPGTLVTFVSTAASATTPQPGEAIDVNGRPAVIQGSTDEAGTVSTTIYLTIGNVVIDSHGNVNRETLEELMASITSFDDQQWAQLVDQVSVSYTTTIPA